MTASTSHPADQGRQFGFVRHHVETPVGPLEVILYGEGTGGVFHPDGEPVTVNRVQHTVRLHLQLAPNDRGGAHCSYSSVRRTDDLLRPASDSAFKKIDSAAREAFLKVQTEHGQEAEVERLRRVVEASQAEVDRLTRELALATSKAADDFNEWAYAAATISETWPEVAV